MCNGGASTRQAATIGGRSRRPRAGFFLILALIGTTCRSRGIGAQEDYDYGYDHPRHQPMRAGGGGEGGGFMGPVAAAAGGFFAMKLLVSGRRKRKTRKAQIEEEKKWEVTKKNDLAMINQQFNQMEASLTASLNEKAIQARALEQFLYSLPDINEDGLITRYEFDKYMSEYKRTHPGLTDRDLPRFEDMDHNNNGHINFNEWEDYQMLAMNQMNQMA